MKRFAWILGALICLKALLVRLYSADLWWHLAAGRAMVETRSFLRTDIFSHTLYGRPWINFEWLSQLGFFGVYGLSGYWGLYAVKILLCVLTIALLIAGASEAGAKGLVFFLLSWAGFKVLQPRLQDRPELFTLVFLGFVVWLVLWARRATPARTKHVPWAIFGLMVLWVNLHGGFVYGLGVLFLFYVGALWAEEKRSYRNFLLKSFGMALVALLFNPYGVKLATLFWELYRQFRFSSPLIHEWKAPGPEIPYFWALYLAGAAAMIGGLLRGNRAVCFWTPAVLMFSVWGTLFYRNAALLAFVAVPFLAETVRVKNAGWFLWAVVLLPVVAEAKILTRPFPHEPVNWIKFPVRACDFVRDNNIQGDMFNNYDAGGYIEWALGPERQTYMDGRYLFYPLLSEFKLRAENLGYMTQVGVDYAIVQYPSEEPHLRPGGPPFPLSELNLLFPRESWALVFWDDAGLVFVKRTPEFVKLATRDEYRALWPYNFEQMEFLLAQGAVKKGEAEKELERHRRETGETIRGQQIENLLKT